ncbi:AMP-binding protein [Desertibacillus haloalkaliphilus]|uniref:AMP-binding protein n=1 Tax=Desertibacillus haloalkaliphilus TaxID=1328930 RepID=UPI001C258A26|nr:AMP-binding protein [Desertibacillus haloalkaliphilus]MBU8906948.1 AMP-binding protein [Desertibacillus haloalkaliphilus]
MRDVEDVQRVLNTDQELIPKQLEYFAKVNGEKTFFYYGEDDKKFSYKTFNELTNQIAHSLKQRGIKKGDRISVFLYHPLITTLSMFAIWKVGAVFCPINFNYKGRLLSYQINDTDPVMLITERKLVPRLNEIKGEISTTNIVVRTAKPEEHDFSEEVMDIGLDQSFNEISFYELFEGATKNLNTTIYYHDTANIIYTSGTTGPAKGVVQSYRWMNAYTYYFRKFNNEKDVIYNDLPLYHVGGAFALVARAAYVGCTVAVWDKFSPQQFWDRIRKSGATNAILLDVMIPWLMKAKESPYDRENTLNKVYMQPLPEYHHDVAKRFGFDFVFAGFGQTESGNGFVSVIQEVEERHGTPVELYKGYSRKDTVKIANQLGVPVNDGRKALRKGYMGKPSPFLEATILGEHDEHCPSGEIGEIAFRPRFPSTILDRYFNKPEATVKVMKNCWFQR